MNQETRKKLKDEFQIHFKDCPDEFGFLEAWIDDYAEAEFKRGYNQRLKDEGKVGERWQHLYL